VYANRGLQLLPQAAVQMEEGLYDRPG